MPNNIKSTQPTYLGNKRITIAALSFSQTLLQDQAAKDIFSASNLVDAKNHAEQYFLVNQVLNQVFIAVKTQDFSFIKLLSKEKTLDVVDALQQIRNVSALHYKETVKDWSAKMLGVDYQEFGTETDNIFTELITMFNQKAA